MAVVTFFFLSRIRKAMALQKEMATMARPQSLEMQKKEFNMALVLVCIVVMFIFCQSIKIIPDFYEALACDYSKRVRVRN